MKKVILAATAALFALAAHANTAPTTVVAAAPLTAEECKVRMDDCKGTAEEVANCKNKLKIENGCK